ncbi:rRNA maturation RNase YbeY [Buchnera aphidicola]|uniref:rRNA maturation RNase YbeY n=1 Tax=Buchnera aphidicola TaxID=9 RepID=UPI003464A7F4
MLKIHFQINCTNKKNIPKKKKITQWIKYLIKKKCEINIIIIDILQMKKINQMYRNQKLATNILSFPFQPPKYTKSLLIGDLIICSEIIKQEAQIQKKKIIMHWAHIIIHGVLHLLGYQHNNHKTQTKMQLQEIKIMKKIGFNNPYI